MWLCRYLSLLFLFSSLQAYAGTPDEIRSAIKSEMSQRHPEPSEGFWSKLGPEALPVLKQMYSESNSSFEKSWLIDGLGYFSDPSVGELLEKEIEATTNAILKKKLLHSLIQSQGEAALGFSETYLKDPEAHVRLETARAIRQYVTGKNADEILARYYENEKATWVKDEVKRTPSLRVAKVATADFPALPESAWTGQWEGFYVSSEKTTRATLTLTLLSASATPLQQKWKAEIKLPKLSVFEIKGKPFEVIYYQSKQRHWIELRNKMDDRVFIGVRK